VTPGVLAAPPVATLRVVCGRKMHVLFV